MSFGLSEMAHDQNGAFIKNDSVYMRIGRNNAGRTHLMKGNFNVDPKEYRFLSRDRIPLRGEHNLQNVMAACTISAVLDLPVEIMQPGIESFEGIPHRLEFIRSWGGADWYNDSIATTPKRAMAAIHSFDMPLVLLAGGRDKNLPWMEFGEMICQRVDHLILFGEASHKILQEMDLSVTEKITVTQCVGLYDAVQEAARIVQPGEVVLLSPGGTSFDEFENYEQRGEYFAQLVKELH
jgi:UDP-N-acetylmuramoylalanine--D-glutamate ligase